MIDQQFWGKVAAILADAIARMDEDDRAQRVAWCQATGRHGVTARHEAGDVAFYWAGALLATVPAADLANPDALLDAPVEVTVPDALPADW